MDFQLKRTRRHINVRYFYLNERIANGEINIKYIESENMVADILTKPLHGKKFRWLRNKLRKIEI